MDTQKYTERPPLNQLKEFSTEPTYTAHERYEDQLAILVCQIKIWRPQGSKWFDIPKAKDCLTLRECHSIEISDTTKEVINKAVVKFSRGTVIAESNKLNTIVITGNTENSTSVSTTVDKATNKGEVVFPTSIVSAEDGTDVTPLEANHVMSGMVNLNEDKNSFEKMTLLSPKSVATGNRIEIRLGYAYSEKEFYEMNTTDNHENLTIAFTGFITGISAGTPLELQCTNMAYVLSCISTPNIVLSKSISIKNFLADNSQYHLLKDTGIKLSEKSKACDVSVAGGAITNNLTITDVLKCWNENAGVLSMMEIMDDGSVELRVGLGYYAGKNGDELPNSNPNYLTYEKKDDANLTTFVQFDWDVAEDKLSVNTVDKKYLAIKATGMSSIGKLIHVTVRKNPNTDEDSWEVDEKGGEFQEVNKNELQKKNVKRRGKKKPKGTGKRMAATSREGATTKTVVSSPINKAKLKEYTVFQYFSTTKNVTPAQLAEEAKEVWRRSNPIGISGDITVFGDIPIRPSQIIGLIDPRNPARDGYYYVEAVQTRFGVGGYRREITIPHRVAKFAKPVQIIR